MKFYAFSMAVSEVQHGKTLTCLVDLSTWIGTELYSRLVKKRCVIKSVTTDLHLLFEISKDSGLAYFLERLSLNFSTSMTPRTVGNYIIDLPRPKESL